MEKAVLKATRLLNACVDVLSSNGWLTPALHSMELIQLLVQAMQPNDHHLKQLPHVSAELLERCKQAKVDTVFDLLEMEDAERNDLLKMDDAQLGDVARFANAYPSLEIQHKLSKLDAEQMQLDVTIQRENDVAPGKFLC